MTKISVSLSVLAFISLVAVKPQAAEGASRKRAGTAPKRETPAPVIETTRLRAKQPVVIYATRSGISRLEHLNVEVINVGFAPAYGIEVTAEWDRGVVYAVKGAKRIGPGRRAIYTLGARHMMLGSGAPRIVVRCENCGR
jgi:hypothetical protein